MPVTFYPEKSVSHLEKLILKDDGTPLHGEIKAYRDLHKSLSESKNNYHVWHDISLPKHIDGYFDGVNSNPLRKTSAQIDFIILCNEGLVVLEVKGGEITYHENQFYYGKTVRKCSDPYSQSNGYKYTLKNRILNEFNGFYSNAVAFPHLAVKFTSRIHNEKQLWSDYTSRLCYNNSIETFLLNWIKTEKKLHQKRGRSFSNFNNRQIQQIINVLITNFLDKNPLPTTEETCEWLEVQNLEILEGLQKNDRIMIEGPPGSGKTTYALAFADRFKMKKGLYLCWNTLLKHTIECRIKNRKLSTNLDVFTFQKFIQDIGDIKFDDIKDLNEIEFFQKTKIAVEKIKASVHYKNYDFIIVDEAQDFVEKGLEIVLNRLCGNNDKGLINGRIILLYDLDQSYSWNGRDVRGDMDYLAEYFAHYKLNETKRSLQATGIKQLSLDVLQDSILTSTSSSITIEEFSSFKDGKKKLLRTYLHSIRDPKSSLIGKDCIVLGESHFYSNRKNATYFPDEFIVSDMEELTNSNVCDTKNMLRHTSIRKFKGLESSNVFLFTKKLSSYNMRCLLEFLEQFKICTYLL